MKEEAEILRHSFRYFFCIDCKISDTGVEYSGTRDVTETLKLCLPWNTLSEHATALQNPDRFPDATLDDAVNYCRNPDRKAGGPWCFYGDSQSQWEYCDIPSCTGKNTLSLCGVVLPTFRTLSKIICQFHFLEMTFNLSTLSHNVDTLIFELAAINM